jgi:hypothetical protein
MKIGGMDQDVAVEGGKLLDVYLVKLRGDLFAVIRGEQSPNPQKEPMPGTSLHKAMLLPPFNEGYLTQILTSDGLHKLKDLGFVECILEIISSWQGITVLDCLSIGCTMVNIRRDPSLDESVCVTALKHEVAPTKL